MEHDDKLLEYLMTAVESSSPEGTTGEEKIRRVQLFMAQMRLTYPKWEVYAKEAALLWILLRFGFQIGGRIGVGIDRDGAAMSAAAWASIIPHDIPIWRERDGSLDETWNCTLAGGHKHMSQTLIDLIATAPSIFRRHEVWQAVDAISRINAGQNILDMVPYIYERPDVPPHQSDEAVPVKAPKRPRARHRGADARPGHEPAVVPQAPAATAQARAAAPVPDAGAVLPQGGTRDGLDQRRAGSV